MGYMYGSNGVLELLPTRVGCAARHVGLLSYVVFCTILRMNTETLQRTLAVYSVASTDIKGLHAYIDTSTEPDRYGTIITIIPEPSILSCNALHAEDAKVRQ